MSSPTIPAPEICIFGAGSIGCYLGGRLLASGATVSLVGRARFRDEVAAHGLRITDFKGADFKVHPIAIRFEEDAAIASSADVILVTVKSAATVDAGRSLASVLKPGAIVVSFQNGLGNAEVLGKTLPGYTVLAGMVPFNVVARGAGAFHQGSDGTLMVTADGSLSSVLPAFTAAGLPLLQRADFRAVQWAKLLLNLNNPINALSNLPLKAELSQRGYRRCLALAQREAIDLLANAGIRPAKLTPLPPHWMPSMLSLPDVLFRLLANKMLAIDPLARSSMWEDLQAGRTTEIDWINGEITKLAQSLGRKAPVNDRLIQLIRDAEGAGVRSWLADDLLNELEESRSEKM